MPVIEDPILLKRLKPISEKVMHNAYSRIITTDYPTDPRFRDLSGQDFGYIHVDKYCGKDVHGTKYFYCTCNYCGNKTIMTNTSILMNTKIKTCGCYKYHHDDTYRRLNKIYFGILRRCYSKDSEEYPKYGGRGITVCDEWLGEHGYLNFRNWAYAHGYSEKNEYEAGENKEYISVDRIDNDKGYSPENCRLADMKLQSNNRSTTRYVWYDKYVFSLQVWSEIVGINRSTLINRLENGWSLKDALLTPSRAWYKRGQDLKELIVPKEYDPYNKYEEFKAKGTLESCVFP